MTLLTSIRKNIALHVVFLLLLGSAIVFINYLTIPKFLTFDEIEFAKLALQLDKSAYVPYSSYATGHATLYFYILLYSFKLFGLSKVALRLPSAICGVLAPVFFYLALRQFFILSKRKGADVWALLIAVLFVTARWYFNFARFGFEATFLIMLELLSLLFVLTYANNKRPIFLILSGAFAGLAYNSYQPGRLFFIIPVTFLFFANFHARGFRSLLSDSFRQLFAIRRNLLLFLAPFILLILPLTIYLGQNPDVRMYQLFYPGNHETSFITKMNWFGEDVWKTFAMFFFKGDMNGRHNYPGKPALNPIMSIFFVIGLYAAFRDRKKTPNWIFYLWLSLSLIPTLLTYPWENPNMLRTITSTPIVAFFTGTALVAGCDKIQILHTRLKTVLIALLILFTAASIIYEVRTYFAYQSTVFQESFEAQKELIYYIDHPDNSASKK